MNASDSPFILRKHYLLAALLSFALLNGLLWSLIIPFDGAPDEVHKYEIVYFIWKYHRLPVFGPSADVYIREAPGTRDGYVYGLTATSPCGAYLLTALAMLLTPSDIPTVLLHTARLTSVICAIITLYLAYRIVRALWGSEIYALGVTALIALIPQFTYTGAYVGEDAYQIMAVTWTIWATTRGIQEGWMLRNRLSLGLALVFVSVGKQNGWVAGFPFVLLALFSTWRGNWRERLQAWASMFLPGCLTLGSWLARNWLLYHDPLALGTARTAWQDYMTRLGLTWIPYSQRGYSLVDLVIGTRWLRTMFESFWGRFFYMDVPMDTRIYLALFAGCLVAAGSTVWAVLRKRDKTLPNQATVKILGCAGLAFVLLFASAAANSLYNDYQAQGRYFFPLIVPIAISLTLGPYVLSTTYPKRVLAAVWAVALGMLCALNAFSLVHYIHGHPYPGIPLPNF